MCHVEHIKPALSSAQVVYTAAFPWTQSCNSISVFIAVGGEIFANVDAISSLPLRWRRSSDEQLQVLCKSKGRVCVCGADFGCVRVHVDRQTCNDLFIIYLNLYLLAATSRRSHLDDACSSLHNVVNVRPICNRCVFTCTSFGVNNYFRHQDPDISKYLKILCCQRPVIW